jgi:hypothetical protein
MPTRRKIISASACGQHRSGAGQQGLLLRGSMSPTSSATACACGRLPRWPRAARSLPCWGGRAGGRARRPCRVQHLKATPSHTQRCPATQGVAGRKACSACSASIEPCQAAPGVAGQHGGRAAGVVGIAVAEHEHVHPLAQRAQQGHQHAVARVAFAAEARAGVVQQVHAWRCAPARHCPGQCRQPAAQTAPAQAAAPATQQRQQQRQTQRAHCHGRRMASSTPPSTGRHARPQRRCGQKHHGPGPGWPATAARRQGLQSPAASDHNGAHSTPASASGVTTSVTHGMASRLATNPTSDTWPNSSRLSGVSASVTTHCSRNNA